MYGEGQKVMTGGREKEGEGEVKKMLGGRVRRKEGRTWRGVEWETIRCGCACTCRSLRKGSSGGPGALKLSGKKSFNSFLKLKSFWLLSYKNIP